MEKIDKLVVNMKSFVKLNAVRYVFSTCRENLIKIKLNSKLNSSNKWMLSNIISYSHKKLTLSTKLILGLEARFSGK